MKTNVVVSVMLFFVTLLLIGNQFGARHQVRVREAEEGTSGALRALEYWSLPREYPGTPDAAGKYFRAYEAARQVDYRTAKAAAVPMTPWEFLGPMNAQGRCITMAINPRNGNSLYVGTASGGLWHGEISYDTLHQVVPHWQRVPFGYPVLGVKAIAIDSVDTNTIYIGTGEVYRYQNSRGGVAIRTTRGSFGMGILKTTDGGTSWTKSLDWSYADQRGVEQIRINPFNHRTVFAATTEGIFRSYDAGASWTNVLDTLMGEDVLINGSDTNNILASCGNFSTPGAGLYSSIDGGTTWFPVSSGLPKFSGKAVFEQSGSDPNAVYVSMADSTSGAGGFYKSTNFGWDWTTIIAFPENQFGTMFGSSGSAQGWYSHYIAVHPTNPNRIVFASVKLMRTTDGGTNFLGAGDAHDDHHYHAHDPKFPDILYEVNDAGIARSTDFGATFENIGYGLVSAQFYNGFASSATDSNFALGAMQDNIPGWQYNGTVDWPNADIDEVGWSAIDPTNANIVYDVTRQGQTVAKSTDHASTYPQMTAPAGIGAWNSPIVIAPSNTNVLYFGKTNVFKSTTGGTSWSSTPGSSSLDGNPALALAISSTSTDTVYMATAPVNGPPHCYRTTNGGTAWEDITGPLPNRYPMDLGVDPTNSAVVYAVYGGYGTGHVFKSTSAGLSWGDITGTLPDVNTSAVVVDPANSNHVYVGNDIGVYASTDGGSSWFPFNGGMPEAVIVSNLAICNANHTLRASTHGSGLYQHKLLSTLTGVDEGNGTAVPLRTSLAQNYPNPFNPSTTIRYTIGSSAFVTLNVYDITGREVARLVRQNMKPGTYSAKWDAASRGELPSGMYFCRLTSAGADQTIKMMLVK
jgi:photosystem II stability/assembly factor-like uncharacterized protein